MNELFLNGFTLVDGTKDDFDIASLENNKMYLIRTNEDKTEGYIYINGKTYGDVSPLNRRFDEEIGNISAILSQVLYEK